MDCLKSGMSGFTIAKICRLCESKDGPFLNIFGPTMDIAKKIESVLLLTINENDDLPHKICYRCSAKLQDFEEFLNVCIKTQENLSKCLGKKFSQKNPNTRKIKFSWEAKLTENKISNEEYCDELIKKALELATGMKPPDEGYDKRMLKKHNIRKHHVRLLRCDGQGYPGVQRRGGKYYLVDIKKIPKLLPDKKPPVKKISTVDLCEKPNSQNNEAWNNPDLMKLSSGTKIVLKNVNSKPVVVQSEPKPPPKKAETPAVPDTFTTVKVSGVGPVYTCKNCDTVILELQKVINHKCINFRGIKGALATKVAPKPAGPVVQQDSSSRYKPGPARVKRKMYQPPDEEGKADREESGEPPKKMPAIPTNNVPLNVDYTNMQMFNLKDHAMVDTSNNSNQYYGYQFPTNFFLVPSGNNTFALKAGPPPIMVPPPIVANPQPAPPTPAPTRPPQSVPTDSILPDINTPPVFKPNVTNVKIDLTKASNKSKKSKQKVAATPTPAPPSVVQTKPQTNNQQTNKKEPNILKKKSEVKGPPPAPYPIGLLCRKNSSEVQSQSSSSSSKDPEYPQYTILPPKTPGKIIISTVAAKKIPAPDSDDSNVEPKTKRRKQAVAGAHINQSAEDNQHFFTYVNLDSMLGPPSMLPIETVQESRVTTTVKPYAEVKKKSNSGTQVKVTEASNNANSEPYTCSICDLTFSREKKLLAHVRLHYQPYEED